MYFVSQPIVTNGLVLNLDAGNTLSYTSGSSTWRDLSGNNTNSSLTTGSIFDPSNGGCIAFNGVNSSGSFPAVNIASNGSISFWFYRTGNGTPDGGNVVDIIANVTDAGTFGWSAGLKVTTNKLNFYIGNNGFVGSEDLSVNNINLNTWYNAVFTFNGSTKVIYLNGALDSSYASAVNGTSTNTWGIGSRTLLSRYFQGKVANVQLYNRALTPSEVQQNFNALRGRYGI